MWFIRRMQKISWKEKKTNEQVLRETIGKRKILQKIVQPQVSFFRHVMRKGQPENIVTTAKINGKRKRGKPSIQYMDQIKKWTQQDSIKSLMSKIYERTLLVAQVYWQGTQRRRPNCLLSNHNWILFLGAIQTEYIKSTPDFSEFSRTRLTWVTVNGTWLDCSSLFFLFHNCGTPIDPTLSSRCDTIETKLDWIVILNIARRWFTYPAHQQTWLRRPFISPLNSNLGYEFLRS